MYIVQGLLHEKSCLCESIECWHIIFQDFLEMVKKFIRSNDKVRSQIEKKGTGSPGTLKKVLGLLEFFSPGTTGPRDLQDL